ncbi:MAG TPA: acyl-CoA thioesterase domain-containing protein, partial [Acidimicrobiales bacterium]|nr:acyl-CoA thioesterase domain-containing protein [Acidimicrobiales bacterium]
LRAAAATVDDGYHVHSLHAYFIRGGDHDEPIRFEVDRLRNGRSFVTRSVVARQAVGAILGMSASFQRPESGPTVERAVAPTIDRPDDADPNQWSEMFEGHKVAEPGHRTNWFKMSEPIGDDPLMQACALAYVSDDTPCDTVASQHPDATPGDEDDHDSWMVASLDHAIWFHRTPSLDDWLLTDTLCHGLLSSRGLAVGNAFDTAGNHVATFTQEVLVRHR